MADHVSHSNSVMKNVFARLPPSIPTVLGEKTQSFTQVRQALYRWATSLFSTAFVLSLVTREHRRRAGLNLGPHDLNDCILCKLTHSTTLHMKYLKLILLSTLLTDNTSNTSFLSVNYECLWIQELEKKEILSYWQSLAMSHILWHSFLQRWNLIPFPFCNAGCD